LHVAHAEAGHRRFQERGSPLEAFHELHPEVRAGDGHREARQAGTRPEIGDVPGLGSQTGEGPKGIQDVSLPQARHIPGRDHARRNRSLDQKIVIPAERRHRVGRHALDHGFSFT
jgi:hypothetical protein